MTVSRSGSGGAKVGCLWGVDIGTGLQRFAGKFKLFFSYKSLALRTKLATPHHFVEDSDLESSTKKL